VAEFNDKFMGREYFKDSKYLKMGLGIDEVIAASCNLSRKNYIDYFPEEPYPRDVKMVGNTIKSKKMPVYIEKFLDKAVRMLLKQQGQEFIEEYYAYIDRIYNYKIPLQEIASKGKVKRTLAEYVEDCKTITAAGRPKSRQAWMELALRENLKVNLGETLYYINTGNSKAQGDTKKVTHYYMVEGLFDDRVDVRKRLEAEWKKNSIDGKLADVEHRLDLRSYVEKHHPEVDIEDEVILNCTLLSNEIVESDEDVFCKPGEEYNVPKYVDQFNKRITPLLVCFHPDIRSRILVQNPSDRQYFTKEECELCSGYPNKSSDQDTYEQLMAMEDKEIKFWMAHEEWEIPFLKECGMDWEEIKRDYLERMEREKQLGVDRVRESFQEALDKLTDEDFEKFEDGELPKKIDDLIDIDPKTGNFVHKEYTDITIGTIYDVFDAMENKRQAKGDAIENASAENH